MEKALKYFEEIMAIPRESGHEEQILDYLINYAKKNNLEYRVGKYNTIFLKKNNNSSKTIILQAHSDMVCVSSEEFDFSQNGIPFYIEGDYYKSETTSLGADDGIGIALILAILEENKDMPNIEVMITTEEETTMLGALNFDYSLFKSQTLISLDGIKEADIESSSAGMCSLTLTKNINFQNTTDKAFKLTISGLKGGHSGDDIAKNRCNAIKLVINIIKQLEIKSICDINFGKRDNVIPSEGYIIFTSNEIKESLNNKLDNINLNLSEEDFNLHFTLEETENKNYITESHELIELISKIKNGLLETYPDDSFPLLSTNIGKISLIDDKVEIKYSIRSSDISKETDLLNEIESLCNDYGFAFKLDAQKPFFPFKESSYIRNLLAETYEDLYNEKTTIKKVHACMEGGIISNNIKDLDICTIAPTIENCHSINERVSISSTVRVYNWLHETLIRFNKEK